MSEEQAIQAIRLRHRLRAMIADRPSDASVGQTLDALSALGERLEDPVLQAEHRRWRVLLGQRPTPAGR